MPFSIEIPQLLPLSYASSRWEVSWAFEVHAKVRWGRDLILRVPLSVVPRALRGERSQRSYLAPPSIGSDRLRGLWSNVAARCGLTLEESGRLSGALDDLKMEVRREHRGREGIFVVGEISYPCLHLRLSIEPARGLRRLVGGGGVEIGDGQWDSQQQVEGREPAQVAALSRAMLDALAPFIPVTMDDSQLRVEWRDAGQRPRQLQRFVELLLGAARALIVARDAIPPPREMADDLPSWRELAAELGCDLQKTRMAAAGTFEGLPALVATEWSAAGAPDRTLLSLRPELSIDDRCAIELAAAGAAGLDSEQLDAAATKLPRAAAQLLHELVEGALALSIAPRELALELPAPQRDHRALLSKLAQLVRMAEALRPMAGPYR